MSQPYNSNETTVMLLAAGRGKRMRPLTDDTPKPLLKVGQHSLIEHHLKRLSRQGFTDVVINTAYLAEQIRDAIGNGDKYGLSVRYSDESSTGALETAGGVKNALPLIVSDPFITVNADIWTDFDFRTLLSPLDVLGRLVMVSNPEHNPTGDFAISQHHLLCIGGDALTFSGIALYHKQLFKQLDDGKLALFPIFCRLIAQQQLEGIHYQGLWTDVGAPERLAELRLNHIKAKK